MQTTHNSLKPLCIGLIAGDFRRTTILWQRHAQMAAVATRELPAISAAAAELPAATKCQFGGLLPHIRLPFRRKLCE
ncbi:MAG: hypothetical protein H0X30_05680 [Anaerolineae bacterium]|nr:hypothetical protein [Anaerolineae bacterium]